MSDIRAFLTARWDNLHLQAVDRMENGPTRTVYQLGGGTEQVREGAGYWRYVLDDLAAKRAILAEHPAVTERTGWSSEESICDRCRYDEGLDTYAYPCPTVRALAHPFRQHPDFDPVWRVGP